MLSRTYYAQNYAGIIGRSLDITVSYPTSAITYFTKKHVTNPSYSLKVLYFVRKTPVTLT